MHTPGRHDAIVEHQHSMHQHNHAGGCSRPREPLEAAAALFDSGNERAEAGDLQGGLEAFERAVLLDPGCALLHEATAQLHNELGMWHQASC